MSLERIAWTVIAGRLIPFEKGRAWRRREPKAIGENMRRMGLRARRQAAIRNIPGSMTDHTIRWTDDPIAQNISDLLPDILLWVLTGVISPCAVLEKGHHTNAGTDQPSVGEQAISS